MLGLAEIAAGQELAAAQFNCGTRHDRVGCCRKALFAGVLNIEPYTTKTGNGPF